MLEKMQHRLMPDEAKLLKKYAPELAYEIEPLDNYRPSQLQSQMIDKSQTFISQHIQRENLSTSILNTQNSTPIMLYTQQLKQKYSQRKKAMEKILDEQQNEIQQLKVEKQQIHQYILMREEEMDRMISEWNKERDNQVIHLENQIKQDQEIQKYLELQVETLRNQVFQMKSENIQIINKFHYQMEEAIKQAKEETHQEDYDLQLDNIRGLKQEISEIVVVLVEAKQALDQEKRKIISSQSNQPTRNLSENRLEAQFSSLKSQLQKFMQDKIEQNK